MATLITSATGTAILGVLGALLLVLTTVNLGSLMPNRSSRLQVVIGLAAMTIAWLGLPAIRHHVFGKYLLLYADILIPINLALIGSRSAIRNAARVQVQTGDRVDLPPRVTWRVAATMLVAFGGLYVAEILLVPGV